jgi:hypothetical protein
VGQVPEEGAVGDGGGPRTLDGTGQGGSAADGLVVKNRLWVTVRVAPNVLSMAPAAPLPPTPRASLFDRMSLATIKLLPVFNMPPPMTATPTTLPSLIVRPAMVTVAPPLMLKTRLW